MTSLKTLLAPLKKGLSCLVAKTGSGLFSSHEKTLCDCQVSCLIAAIERLEEGLRYYAEDPYFDEKSHIAIRCSFRSNECAKRALSAAADILAGKGEI